MSIASALAYEEEIEKMLRLVARDEALRAPAVTLVNSNSTLEWEPIPFEPDPHFQEMMQHLRHRVAQEMAVPAHMLRPSPSSAEEVRQRQREQVMHLYLREDGGFSEEARLLRERILAERELSRESEEVPEEVVPVPKKYGRVLEP